MIVLAFANGDRRALKDLLSSEVYESFETVIKDREKHEQKTETRFVSIDKAELVGAEARDRAAQLTVRFVSQMITATRDKAGSSRRRQPRYGRRYHRCLDLRPRHHFTRSELEAGWHGKRSITRAAPAGTPSRLARSLRYCRWRHRAHQPRIVPMLRITARPQLPAVRPLPYPQLAWPLEISGGQYAPVAWADIAGWREDDHLPAYKAFRISCKPIAAQRKPPAEPKALGTSLRDPCRAARALDIDDGAKAKAFFEEHFLPLRISRLGEAEGFVTGYYEPIIDGSRTQTEVYTVPVYRRPSNLFVRGAKQSSAGLPNKGQVFRKIGRRKLVPYYDRAEIEDGAIAGRGLEIVWLKNQTDLLFTQIQGSARVKPRGRLHRPHQLRRA